MIDVIATVLLGVASLGVSWLALLAGLFLVCWLVAKTCPELLSYLPFALTMIATKIVLTLLMGLFLVCWLVEKTCPELLSYLPLALTMTATKIVLTLL